MSILISHIHQDDYSGKIKHNKFFYSYSFFLGSFTFLQIYTLYYFYSHSFSYDAMNEIVFEPINETISHKKDVYLRNVKPKQHYIIPDYKTFLFEIIKKDIHSSLFINIFTLFAVIYVYNKYNSIFLKWILQNKFSIQRHHFIMYLASISYVLNSSYSIFVHKIWNINKLDANVDNLDFFIKCVYKYYCLKYGLFLTYISFLTGLFITVLVYRFILKKIKGKLH